MAIVINLTIVTLLFALIANTLDINLSVCVLLFFSKIFQVGYDLLVYGMMGKKVHPSFVSFSTFGKKVVSLLCFC